MSVPVFFSLEMPGVRSNAYASLHGGRECPAGFFQPSGPVLLQPLSGMDTGEIPVELCTGDRDCLEEMGNGGHAAAFGVAAGVFCSKECGSPNRMRQVPGEAGPELLTGSGSSFSGLMPDRRCGMMRQSETGKEEVSG